MVTFIFVAAVLAVILLFSPKLTVHAAFSGHSSEFTLEKLHTDTIATTVNSDAPAITFLTHGLGGSAEHWSNSMYRNEVNNTWVGNSIFSYDSASIIEKIRNQIPSGIKLYIAKMNNPSNPYSFSTNNFTLTEYALDNITNPNAYTITSEDVPSINGFSQHVVVVFDLQYNYYKNNAQVYEELDYIIDKISYDYLEVMGALPKINLIGHSRGGIINMDYAINHPKNVASLISLGTPYTGSWYDNWFVELLGIDDFDSIGGADIVNTTLINTRKTNWNSVYAQNTHINFHAISGTAELSLMNHIIWDDDHLEVHLPGKEDLIRTAYILSPMVIAGVYFLPGDVVVDKSSQEASGYNGVNRYNKEFTESDSNCNKRSRNHLPVPHNLETYDDDIHDYIFDNVTFGIPFDTTNIGLSEIRIDKANFTLSGSFNIPATFNGRTVTSIGNYAFAYQNMVNEFIIPACVTSIGNGAFKDCTELRNINIPNNVRRRGWF